LGIPSTKHTHKRSPAQRRLETARAAAERRRRRRRILVGAAGFLLVAALVGGLTTLGGGDGDNEETANSSTTSSIPALDKPEVEVPDGPPPKELKIDDIVEGDGPAAKAGDQLDMHYVGVLYDTKEEFDASYNRGETFPLTLGAGGVIPGWDEGIVGMKEGGRRRLIIPPDKAYGAEGRPGIPPNSTLVFVVDVVKLTPSG
jgi:peptidylprolyl isomerase